MHQMERFFVYCFFGLGMALFLWRFHLGASDVFLPVHTPGGVSPDDVPAGPNPEDVPPNAYVGLSPGFNDAGPPGPAIYTATSQVARPLMPPPPRVVQ